MGNDPGFLTSQCGKQQQALHLIVGVTPMWLEQQAVDAATRAAASAAKPGQEAAAYAQARAEALQRGKAHRHDPENPAIQRLMEQVLVCDLLCTPLRPNQASGKMWASINKAQDEFRARYKPRDWDEENTYENKKKEKKVRLYTGYHALQDSWAQWVQAHLDAGIRRGESKALTKRLNLRPEVYGLQAKEQMTADQGAIAEGQAELDAEQRQLVTDGLALREQREAVAAREQRLQAGRRALEEFVRETETLRATAEKEEAEAKARASSSEPSWGGPSNSAWESPCRPSRSGNGNRGRGATKRLGHGLDNRRQL